MQRSAFVATACKRGCRCHDYGRSAEPSHQLPLSCRAWLELAAAVQRAGADKIDSDGFLRILTRLAAVPRADADEIDFDGFLRMLKVGSVDHLDQYESRHQSSASQHGGAHFGDLSTVAE